MFVVNEKASGKFLAKHDDIFNVTMKEDLQYRENDKAWRGVRQKGTLFMEMLICNFSKPGVIVLDIKGATSMTK